MHFTKKICEAVGYSYDFSAWEAKEEYKFLFICNTLPFAWYMPQFARALPHWTVEEYFEKLELFMGCEFKIDHRARHISFAFTKDIVAAKPTVVLDNVVEEHSTEVKVENDKCEYSEAKNLAYKDSSHSMWKFYSCDWFVKSWTEVGANVVRYEHMSELLADNQGLASWDGSNARGSNLNKLLYAENIDTYFIIRTVSRTDTGNRLQGGQIIVWEYKCVLQPGNLLGPRIVDDSDEAPTDEIEFVPAYIDYTDEDNGFALFLSFCGYDEESSSVVGTGAHITSPEDHYAERNAWFAKSLSEQALSAGESEKKAEYYDRIYIAWWYGATSMGATTPPHPHVENVVVNDDWSGYFHPHFSLRLNDSHSNRGSMAYSIVPTQKSSFKFLADSIPDVRSLFIIRGKRYVCEKLTATFTESGMSQLIKGDFYPVKD